MRALDSSVAVAALAEWHEAHGQVVAALDAEDRLVGHAALEVYSVLTRLPAPLRLEPADAGAVLHARFPPPYLAIASGEQDALVTRLAGLGVRGGAVYDALVGITAAHSGSVLLSRDDRAAVTYRALGVAYERLG